MQRLEMKAKLREMALEARDLRRTLDIVGDDVDADQAYDLRAMAAIIIGKVFKAIEETDVRTLAIGPVRIHVDLRENDYWWFFEDVNHGEPSDGRITGIIGKLIAAELKELFVEPDWSLEVKPYKDIIDVIVGVKTAK